MRKLSKMEIGVLVGSMIVTGITHGQSEMQPVTVWGYQYQTFTWAPFFAADYTSTPPTGSGPGGVYSATPTAHTNCTTNTLSSAQNSGSKSPPSTPTNTALAFPLRYANPINISNGNPIGSQYGGVNGAGGFMIFPNLADGTNAAIASVQSYSNKGYTITQLVNIWAPASVNPNSLPITLGDLGISSTLAGSTQLSVLTSSQIMQFVAAFAWQEGFKPAGC